MARRKTASAQAIRDMRELEIDVKLIEGHIGELHVLNAEIGIITKEEVKKIKKETKARTYAPKAIPTPKHIYNRRIVVNVDGTVSVEVTEWDYK